MTATDKPADDGRKQRPQDKWDKKAGVISKTYKVNKEVAEQFQDACKARGVAMGTQLTAMMQAFVNEGTGNN